MTSQPTHPSCPHTFHPGLIRSDGGALDSHAVLLGGQCGVNGDLVISLVTVWEPQVEILELDIHMGQDELETEPGQGISPDTLTQGHVQAAAGDTQSGQG